MPNQVTSAARKALDHFSEHPNTVRRDYAVAAYANFGEDIFLTSRRLGITRWELQKILTSSSRIRRTTRC